MKKQLTFILLLWFLYSHAQNDTFTNHQNKHEFRLDAFDLVAIPNLEINYEYILNKFSGVGMALSVSLDNDSFAERQKYAIEPYFRQYFFNKKDYGARGLFVEGLIRFAGGEENTSELDIDVPSEGDLFDIGAGFVIGQKWVSQNGFVFEISLGAGRFFLDEDPDEIFVRGGIYIGYRLF